MQRPCWAVDNHTLLHSNTVCKGEGTTAVEKTIISFRIRKEVKDALQKLADADRRSLSSYIDFALGDHVSAQKAAAKKKGGRRK